MKKFSFLLIFTLCFASLLGGTSFLTKTANAEVSADANETTISSAQDFVDYIDGYGAENQNDKIFLGGNIDFDELNTTDESGASVPFVLTKTIGTKELPFQGTFDGNGYEIQNLRINLGQSEDTEDAEKTKNKIENVGLFGYVEGAFDAATSSMKKAEIKNVALSLVSSIGVDGVEGANMGLLIGTASDAVISHVQLTPQSVAVNFPTNSSVNFGLLAGVVRNCDISNILCRTTNFGDWSFTDYDGKMLYLGGVVGQVYNSKLSYVITQETFTLSFNEFFGDLYFGGVAGLISDGGSEIFNIGIENNYTIPSVPQNVYYGEVAGGIGNRPSKGNVNFIHYKQNNIAPFGNANGYDVDNTEISPTPASLRLSALQQDSLGNYTYFELQNWHNTREYWNFDSVWYVNSQRLYLQNFITNFIVRFTGLNSSVLELETVVQNTYRYGEEASFDFVFKEIEDDSESDEPDKPKEDMRKYYTFSYIELKGVQYNVKTTEDADGNVQEYSVTSDNKGNLLFEVEKTDKGFTFIIKSLSNLTSGTYTLRVVAKQHTISFSTRLYDDDGQVEGQNPGYIYYGSTKVEHFTLSTLKYGDTYQIQTEAKLNQPYAFEGWFMVVDGQEEDITPCDDKGNKILVKILTLNFGTGNFTKNCEVYAKYSMNACEVLFNIDGGIFQIVCGGQTVDESLITNGILLPKYESQLRLEIYVNPGYTFNVDEFIEEMTVYKTQSEGNFCELREDNITTDGQHYYLFLLNMTILGDDYSDQFTINAKTVSSNSGSGNMIWYIIGGVSGVVLIVLVIVLVVLLVRRRNGGFGGGSGKMKTPKMNKKAYKNMYF